MKITVEMPAVNECSVSECAYNLNKACHARAITVGDGIHPGCDTYLGSAGHIRDKGISAGVGACKVTGCSHNDDYECAASSIDVGFEGTEIHCLTFSPRGG